MRKVSMKKISEVLRFHFKLELSVRQSASAANVSRQTASNYRNRFNEIALNIDEFLQLNEAQQEQLFYPRQSKTINPSKVMPDCNYIHNELKKKKVTMALLHDEYKENNPDNYYGYSQFREYYARYKKVLNPSMKQVHLAGDKVFVDYSGLTIPIYNSKTGEATASQIFVAVLGASGYTYVHATYSQKQRDFILSHTLAYDFFGGCPRIVVPDNLKSAVIKNNKYGIVINEAYLALARHYSMAVQPARPYKPKDKSKAEQGVQAIQRWILARFRNRKFFNVDELNDAISVLLDTYNNKIIKRFGKSRIQLFEELDQPALQLIPANKYIYREFKICTVTHNYHIWLEKCEYSVPFKYLHHKVESRYSSKTVEIYYKGKLIASHPKLHFKGDVSTQTEHMPKSHEYQSLKTNPGSYLNWASNIGINTVTWVKKEFEKVEHAPNVYSKLNAILTLAKTYGKYELDLAIGYASIHNLTNTASVKSILDKKLYLQNAVNNTSQVNTTVFNTHDNLRGNIYQ